MANTTDVDRFRENLQAEYDAIALYTRLAKAEPNADLAKVYTRLAETEARHAAVWAEKLKEAGVVVPPNRPSWRSRTLGWLASRFGNGLVLPTITAIEQGASRGYDHQSDAVAWACPAMSVRMPACSVTCLELPKVWKAARLRDSKGGNRAAGGNALRAGVLGANDGLLSVFSLVMGVAGAGRPSGEILLTGAAGLMAGALSMALGEWISVQSSRELYEHQLKIEKAELDSNPEAEAEELALIYQAKGLAPEEAQKLAQRLIADPVTALDTLAREELNIDPEELGGSAWEAALMSFGLFAVGGILPVLPYLIWTGTAGIVASATAISSRFVCHGRDHHPDDRAQRDPFRSAHGDVRAACRSPDFWHRPFDRHQPRVRIT